MSKAPQNTLTSPSIHTASGTFAAKAAGRWIAHGLTVVDGLGGVFDPGAIVVEGAKLVAVGSEAELLARYPTATRLDASGYVAMPGLINAHTHQAMGFFRGLGHGRPAMIENFLFPAEKALTPDLIEPLCYSYIYAGLRSGVTCFSDHYYFSAGVAQAAERMGVRAFIGETVADLGGAFPGAEALQRARELIESWPFSSRVRPVVAPHAADTVSKPLMRQLVDLAKAHDLPLHLHLSQTTGERARVLAREGMSPVSYAEACGVLGERTLAVHLIAIDDEDARKLADHGVTAGFCPASQAIYEFIAPVELLAARGVPIAVGTDCAASNDDADMFGELRLTAVLFAERGMPELLARPQELLAMGTRNAARVLGAGQTLGVLAPGYAADVVFLERSLDVEPLQAPDADCLFSFGSRHVRHVMVDGRFVLCDGKLALANAADLTSGYVHAVRELKKRAGLG